MSFSGTVARITACALSHIFAARHALISGIWPALVVEDDVTFEPLINQPGGIQAIDDAIESAFCESGGRWAILQLGYLLPSARVAAMGLVSGAAVRQRDACSADFNMVGIQAYLLSKRE